MQFPVAIELRHSTWLSLLVVSAHVLAAAGLLGLPWPWLLRAAGSLVILLLAGRFLSRPLAIVSLVLSSQNELKCRYVDREMRSLQVMPDSTVFAQLIVLRLRVDDEKKIISLVLLPDQMNGEQFRLLRLWLRWQAANDDVSSAS